MSTSILFLCLTFAASDSGSRVDTRTMRPDTSPEAERLLQIVEDRRNSYAERRAALDRLGERREPGTVPRLIALLPGQGDVITLRVVYILGQMGDRRALPALRAMRDGPIDFAGKINVAVDGAIEQLERR